IIVMKYVEGGNLRQYLQKNYSKLEFKEKIDQLHRIASGLNSIHEQNWVHRDFHSGNILSRKDLSNNFLCYVTDLGLCRTTNETDQDKVYGVLPYITPEVLREKPYEKASDIYSFGIIAYELLANSYPYAE
ncbi:kinase-like domain-containing protein, partial [Glomus cerebriforme]